MKINVFDFFRHIPSNTAGKIVMILGFENNQEIYGDMFPGAQANYEYIHMWDENKKSIQLRALNKYPVSEIEIINKFEAWKIKT